MKKNVLYLTIISAILILVGWSQIGKALATQGPKAVVMAANPRVAVPDYPADGKLFNEMYRKKLPSSFHREAPDYSLDAEFFNDWYRDAPLSSQNLWIPDYPLDGKVFADHYAASP